MVLGANIKIIDVSRKPITDYVFDAVVNFNQGIDEIIIKGRGDFISKLLMSIGYCQKD